MPEDDNCYFLLEINIGASGGDASEIFSVQITTRKGVESRLKNRGFLVLRKIIILDTYSWANLNNILNEFIDSCTSDSWEKVSHKLAYHFNWEFESYVEEP
jgi:hypothetical protein